jgi:DNA mismatch repair protein MutS2
MPEAVLQNAEQRVPVVEREVSALLEDLQRRETALREREAAIAGHEDAVRRRAARIAERERTVRERELEVERAARRDARRYVLDARRKIEAAIGAVRSAGSAEVEARAAAARRAAERLLAEQTEALARIDATAAEDARDGASGSAGGSDRTEQRAIAVGDSVAVGALDGKAGRVLELRADDAVVAVGTIRVTVPLGTLRHVSARRLAPQERVPVPVGDLPTIDARHELDVRGLRVAEVDGAVLRALDDAVRADLRSLRIIHGKGTGALRDRVAALLAPDPRVHQFRLGAWDEGGAGVTVVELA